MKTLFEKFDILEQLKRERTEVDAVIWGALDYYSDHNQLMDDLLNRYNKLIALDADIVGQYEEIIEELEGGIK